MTAGLLPFIPHFLVVSFEYVLSLQMFPTFYNLACKSTLSFSAVKWYLFPANYFLFLVPNLSWSNGLCKFLFASFVLYYFVSFYSFSIGILNCLNFKLFWTPLKETLAIGLMGIIFRVVLIGACSAKCRNGETNNSFYSFAYIEPVTV